MPNTAIMHWDNASTAEILSYNEQVWLRAMVKIFARAKKVVH